MNYNGRDLALLVLRFGLGINMLMHGLVRFPKLFSFADKMVVDFEKTLLPALLVRSFGIILPILEFGVGALILLGGRLLGIGLVGGGFVITLLMFGTALREEWATLGSQVIYLAVFAFGLVLTDTRRH